MWKEASQSKNIIPERASLPIDITPSKRVRLRHYFSDTGVLADFPPTQPSTFSEAHPERELANSLALTYVRASTIK